MKKKEKKKNLVGSVSSHTTHITASHTFLTVEFQVQYLPASGYVK